MAPIKMMEAVNMLRIHMNQKGNPCWNLGLNILSWLIIFHVVVD